MISLTHTNRQNFIRSLVLIFILLLIYSITPRSTQNTIDLPTFSPASIHLVTGLLANRDYAWNAEENRQNETGAWLLDPLLDHINKTVYNSDILLTYTNIKSFAILNRFAQQTWQQDILKSLSTRNNIDIRPIAQYKRSQECPYYFTYIIDQYYALPEIILFSHGRPEVHNPHIIQQWSWFIEQVQHDKYRQFFNASIGYLSSNCGIYVKRYIGSRPILD
ncbi:hypothetical protein I4U23_017411 [Adineta vaga]|nr:hypothetical protein I4U23_017411 [Adineta vaga]